LRQTGDEVGRTGPVLPRQHHPSLATRARVAVSHVAAGPLIVNADEPDVGCIVERVEHLHGRRADQAEDVFHRFGLQRFDRRLAT